MKISFLSALLGLLTVGISGYAMADENLAESAGQVESMPTQPMSQTASPTILCNSDVPGATYMYRVTKQLFQNLPLTVI